MMGHLPFRINNGSFPDFHDAVACAEASSRRGLDQIDVRPLQAMVVDVIRDFTQ
jgi:hypothetical protein